MANPFQVNVLGGLNIGDELRKSQVFGQQQREQERLATQRTKMQEAMRGAVKGDADAIEALFTLNPQMAMKMEQRLVDRTAKKGALANKASVQAEGEWAIKYRQALKTGNPEALQTLIDEAESNPLIDFDQTMIGKDPNQDNLVINSMLFKWLGKDGYKSMFGPVGGTTKPAEQLAFEALIKDFTPEQQKLARLTKAGLRGRKVSDAVLSAIESDQIKSYAEAKAVIKQAEAFAGATGASRARIIDKGFEKIAKIDAGLRNIDRAIDALNRGAGVGAIEQYLPSFKAASVEMDNIQKSMALDVIGSVTFGALSKGELDLAREVALPTGLDTPELIDYLQRRKIAQGKLRAYYNEQIQFLDQGGTVAGFLRMKEQSQDKSQAQPNEGQQNTQDVDLSTLSIEQLMQLKSQNQTPQG